MALLFDSVVVPEVAIRGSDLGYPVRRIYCVGRNYAEHARVAVRNVRRDGMDQIKKAKAEGMSEDDQKLWESEVQALTDRYIKLVDEALELMLAYDRQLEDLQGRLEVRLPECPTHTHTYLLVRDVACDAPLHSCRAAGRSSARSSGGAPRGSTRRIASRKTSTSSVRASASTSPPGSATSAHARGKGGRRLAG